MQLGDPWHVWFRRQLQANSWTCLPVSLDVIERAFGFSDFPNNDPADRIIAATALADGLILVTTDTKLLGYAALQTLS